ncbi:TIGR04222 domain-containing membrane protein [Streptomyces sp. LE64]|uniref:TIGR04222 domain-containing membrane protein n=1 Tax=Streptomyces sp. LE64 TaxID=3448653 RepID=UPI00404284BB
MLWLLLLSACAVAGTSCARLCRAAVHAAVAGAPATHGHRLTVYEAAYLSGGPVRVAEVTMVSMARQRRLLLAHTGWVTVVDPHGRDALERAVLRAIGSGGQSRIAPVRAATAGGAPVQALADRLVAAGLAVPEGTRRTVRSALRQVRGALLVVLGLGGVALFTTPPDAGGSSSAVAWFALPLVLTVSCLLIARVEGRPYTGWASGPGRRLLCALSARPDGDDRTYLTAVAVAGVAAAGDPGLVTAFAHRDRTAHREHGPGARPGDRGGRGDRDDPERGPARRGR